ncbi:membrane protein [Neisseria arctica]|uniref:Probable membrane transporter protein n=1 Tax=Neisseria arctica TaxID=1470200 RepID=A0A0J0YQT1_9NEIS|nr:sulfite exporter TauE/SafE family protein [Neisseria arctica]KLT72474.1 membrane protein [Neisseria arctica]UOO86374.1 sulfite exporter TauE/SafE family protein [Neisseria arctica]
MWTIEIILAMLAVGAFAGFIAGLLGIGGGMIIVPVVLWVLQLQGLQGLSHAQHIAVGTSFAVMVFTTFSSVLAQNRKGAVDWHIVRNMAPGMVAGVVLGAILAQFISNRALQIFFVVFTVVIALRTLANVKPKPSRHLPERMGLSGVGALFGLISSWVGIGGGSLSVPFMLYCNVPVHRAVGTSAGLAWPIAVAGALGYLISGWGVAGLPAGSLGFWYLPAVVVLSVATVLFAPLGVKVSHKLPSEKLKLAFGLLLLVIAAQMLWKMWG